MKLKIIIIAFCMVALVGCSNNNNKNSSELTSTSSTVSTSSSTQDFSENDNISATDTYMTSANELCREFSKFSYTYLKGYIEWSYLDLENPHLVSKTNTNGKEYIEKWYKVIGGDITTYSALMTNIKHFYTIKLLNKLQETFEGKYMSINDVLYVSEYAGLNGGVMGHDVAYIDSYDVIDENTLKLNLIAYDEYYVTIVREDDIWKIDECDIDTVGILTWLFQDSKPVLPLNK